MVADNVSIVKSAWKFGFAKSNNMEITDLLLQINCIFLLYTFFFRRKATK